MYQPIDSKRQKGRSKLIMLPIIIFIAWFILIVILATIVDNHISKQTRLTLGKIHNVRSAKTHQNFETSESAELPQYPIDHRNHTLIPAISHEAIAQCHKALWHTLETTTFVLPNNETFIITGDIKDMWLRDSAAQIHPLLIPNVFQGKSLVQLDAKLERVVSGLILKTARFIRYDPYANAFKSHNNTNFTKFQRLALGRRGYVATRNYELDSGCYFIRMVYFFHKNFPKHATLMKIEVREAIQILVDLWIAEQKHELDVYPTGDLFDCFECGRSYWYNPNQMPRGGKGTKTNASAGLTWTGFRPSDETCVYHYLIPANMFAVVVLGYVIQMADDLRLHQSLLTRAKKLKIEIQKGIELYGIVSHTKYGKIYAYEVDGLGNYFLMDDANVPSLLSIPYLGYNYDAEIYSNTKKFIFSIDNPNYNKGFNRWTKDIDGIGSSHAHKKWQTIPNDIWPMSIIMKGLISNNSTEKVILVHQLLKASAGTGWMHESFNANDPFNYSRSWFCWPDSLFAELVMSLTTDCPHEGYEKYTVKDWNDYHMAGSIFENIFANSSTSE